MAESAKQHSHEGMMRPPVHFGKGAPKRRKACSKTGALWTVTGTLALVACRSSKKRRQEHPVQIYPVRRKRQSHIHSTQLHSHGSIEDRRGDRPTDIGIGASSRQRMTIERGSARFQRAPAGIRFRRETTHTAYNGGSLRQPHPRQGPVGQLLSPDRSYAAEG